MQTFLSNLHAMADEISNLLKELLLNHSTISKWNEPSPSDPVVFITAHPYKYILKDEGCQIQVKVIDKNRYFQDLINVLSKGFSKSNLRLLSESQKIMSRTIEQQYTGYKNTNEAFNETKIALDTELAIIDQIYNYTNSGILYLPDTNALLFNHKLETWSFENINNFTIVLLPTILGELDSLKINHHNEKVREKSEIIINQIKEYRRRGKLSEGVWIIKDKIKILSVALEPDMEASLPWLDPQNNDDRFLAATIELMRSQPKLPVIIVSRDINLQNKAEFACIPYTEPPSVNIR